MGFLAAGSTDVGLVRKENQDNYLLLPERGVYAVADGMGGHAGGRQASEITVETIRRRLSAAEAIGEALVEEALTEAHARILEEARKNQWEGMGTTLVLAFLADDMWKVVHIGDSRAYVVGEGGIYALTTDHSLVAELLASGSITEAEARVHPHRNVLTRAIGGYVEIMPEWNAVEADAASYLLLCTDGLFNMLDEEEIRQIVLAPELTTAEKADRLVEAANGRGGTDNITVILITREDGV